MAARAVQARSSNPMAGLYADGSRSSRPTSTSSSRAPSEASYRSRPTSQAPSQAPSRAPSSTWGGSTVAPTEDVMLKKRVGLVSGVALIVGTMIGSGIFISPKGVTEGSGSVGMSLVSWTICGIISMLGALSLAELGTMIPQSGAEYAYLLKAYGAPPAFLFAWMFILLLRPASMAIMSLTCAEYIIVPIFADSCGITRDDLVLKKKMLAAICISAVSYAELGTLIPKSGAEYAYFYDSYGPLHRFVGPLPAFIFNWMNTLLLKPASVAIISLAFALYAIEPVFDLCDQPETATKCLAALCILVLCLINCFSVRLATWVQNVFTVTKLLAVVIIIIGGIVNLARVLLIAVNSYSVRWSTWIQVAFCATKLVAMALIAITGIVMLFHGNTRYLASGFAGTETNIAKVTIGLYKGMWAYDGWNNLNYVTEEIINPYVNLPRAIMIGIPLVTLCYLLVNISYFTVMSVPELLESPAVAVMWGHRTLGVMSWLVPFSVACSCFGAANGTLFTSGRLSYVAAREGHMLELLSMIHVKRYTPLPSLVFTSLLALIMIIPGDIESLIDFFNFAVWFFYGGTMTALLLMRYTHKDVIRPYKVPIVFPIIVLIASIWLVVAPIVDQPRIEFLYAFLFIVAGLIFYVPFVYYKIKVPCVAPISGFLQLLMEVSPPSEESTC